MKKVMMACLLITIVLISGCSKPPDTGEPTEPSGQEKPTDFIEETDVPSGESELVKSNLARETSPQVDPEVLETLAQSQTEFALSFYDQIRNGTKNIIF